MKKPKEPTGTGIYAAFVKACKRQTVAPYHEVWDDGRYGAGHPPTVRWVYSGGGLGEWKKEGVKATEEVPDKEWCDKCGRAHTEGQCFWRPEGYETLDTIPLPTPPPPPSPPS